MRARYAIRLLAVALACSPLAATAACADGQTANAEAARHNQDGYAQFEAGEYAEAVEHFSIAYQLEPTNPTIANNLAAAHAALGNAYAQAGDDARALRQFEAARAVNPDLPAAYVGLANLYFARGDYTRAEGALRPYLERMPDDANGHLLLGDILYRTGRTSEAIDMWNRAQDLGVENTDVAARVQKAERELAVESGFEAEGNRYFTIRFRGDRHEDASYHVLRLLGEARRDIGRDLRLYPEQPVEVVLYTTEEFDAATQLKRHVGGLYDGKIRLRVPADPLDLDELRRVVYHEYAHLVIAELTEGRCPYWLNEGLAQWLSEPFTALQRGYLREHGTGDGLPPVASLEELDIRTATAESHRLSNFTAFAAVDYLRDRYSSRYMLALLEHVRDGEPLEEAFRATYHQDYAFLDRAVAAYVYGDRAARR